MKGQALKTEVLRGLAPESAAFLRSCELCEHRCRVDRLAGRTGFCGAGARPLYFSVDVTCGWEPPFAPALEVNASGCNMKCAFCIAGKPGQDARCGVRLSRKDISERVSSEIAEGIRSVILLGGEPTIHLPEMVHIARAVRGSVPVVWKSNMFFTPRVVPLLARSMSVCLADLKFGNDRCAKRLAGVRNYTGIVRRNLLLTMSAMPLVVRHVILPGHTECCLKPIISWLAKEMPGVSVNLSNPYIPAHRAGQFAEISRHITIEELKRASELAGQAGLRLVRPGAIGNDEGRVPAAESEVRIAADGTVLVDNITRELARVLTGPGGLRPLIVPADKGREGSFQHESRRSARHRTA